MNRFIKIFSLVVLTLAVSASSYAEKVVLEGSTTVLPIAQKAAEVFMDKNPGSDISVRGGGSGVGIASLVAGTCDIGDASRAIKQEELDKAIANGRHPKANVIAMDGICVIVNNENSVSALTKSQIKDIFTGAISNWSRVGGPDEKIVVISRDSSSGTFDAFDSLALGGAKTRSDALMQASNQAVATTVAGTPGAIGYVGLGYVTSAIKAVDVDGVKASKETVLNGKYLLSRPLFMYTNGAPKGLAEKLINFILSADGQKLVEGEGFVALSK